MNRAKMKNKKITYDEIEGLLYRLIDNVVIYDSCINKTELQNILLNEIKELKKNKKV